MTPVSEDYEEAFKDFVAERMKNGQRRFMLDDFTRYLGQTMSSDLATHSRAESGIHAYRKTIVNMSSEFGKYIENEYENWGYVGRLLEEKGYYRVTPESGPDWLINPSLDQDGRWKARVSDHALSEIEGVIDSAEKQRVPIDERKFADHLRVPNLPPPIPQEPTKVFSLPPPQPAASSSLSPRTSVVLSPYAGGKCSWCGISLVPGANWYPSWVKIHSYCCKECNKKRHANRIKKKITEVPAANFPPKEDSAHVVEDALVP